MVESSSAPQWLSAIAGFGGVLVGSLISWAVQSHLLGKRVQADEKLAERKFFFDVELAERKFAYDRDLHDHKRKSEIAEKTLVAILQAAQAITWARHGAVLSGEGKSRKQEEDESQAQQNQRNTYFIPIERLSRDRGIFANLDALRHTFVANFGDEAGRPFEVVAETYLEIMLAANLLIEYASGYENDRTLFPVQLALIGRGTGSRPDDIDVRISTAVADIQAICRPVLGAP